LGAAAELAAFHVILQSRNGGVLVPERGVSNFIEDDNLTRAQYTDGPCRQIDEQVSRRRLAPRNRENPRRDIAEKEGLARLPRPELDKIDIALDEGDQPRYQQQPLPPVGKGG